MVLSNGFDASTVWLFLFLYVCLSVALSSAHNSLLVECARIKVNICWPPKSKNSNENNTIYMCTKQFSNWDSVNKISCTAMETALATFERNSKWPNFLYSPQFFLAWCFLFNKLHYRHIDSHLITNKIKQFTESYCPLLLFPSLHEKT